jgi:ribonuclease D
MLSIEKPLSIWVDQPQLLVDMVDHLRQSPFLAVDTESNSLYAYQEQICLIQFSTETLDYLVDPLALKDLTPIRVLFEDPAIEKIFHAAEYDLICLKRDLSINCVNLFDTMLAARILGREAVGLGSLIEKEFGFMVDKRYQRANWGKRPLSTEMLEYAQQDTHYLISLRRILGDELNKRALSPLAVEDFYRISQVTPPVENGNRCSAWKIPGSQELSPRQITILQELVDYRDSEARAINHPPFKVLSNEVLVVSAATCPKDLVALAEITRMNPQMIRRYGDGILRAIQRGQTRPIIHREATCRKDEAFINRLDTLRRWRKETALKTHVESDVILPREIMVSIAEKVPENLGALNQLMASVPWRFEHFGPSILETLSH